MNYIPDCESCRDRGCDKCVNSIPPTTTIRRMNMCEYSLTPGQWGNEDDPASDWSQANIHAAFKHQNSCEFIFYLSSDSIEDYRKCFSVEFIARCQACLDAGYNYVCFYC